MASMTDQQHTPCVIDGQNRDRRQQEQFMTDNGPQPGYVRGDTHPHNPRTRTQLIRHRHRARRAGLCFRQPAQRPHSGRTSPRHHSALIARIHDGRIRHAALLPPARRLAADHGVSTSTARRGLRLLAALGWARHVPGHPYQAIRPAQPG